MKTIDAQRVGNGEYAEIAFPDEARLPAFQEEFVHAGVRYVRVPSVPRTNQLTKVWRDKGLTSNQFHPFVGKAEGWHKSYDREGRPQFENKRQAKEFARRYSEHHPDRVVTFDP